jgi:hypothetical protein
MNEEWFVVRLSFAVIGYLGQLVVNACNPMPGVSNSSGSKWPGLHRAETH